MAILRVGVAMPKALPPPNYDPPGPGRLRKVALIGSASTIAFAPWWDPSWEIWSHASAYRLCQRVDRYFDLHPKAVWMQKKGWSRNYQEWLAKLDIPIYMQEQFQAVPSSVRYPKERVLAEYPRRYFTSHAAWMIALALSEGVTHLGFFGVHYQVDSEYKRQRSGCEYWMGIAEGRGVQLVIPEGCPLLSEPAWLYGYESHSRDRWQTDSDKPTDTKLSLIIKDGKTELPPLMVLPTGEEPATSRSPQATKE